MPVQTLSTRYETLTGIQLGRYINQSSGSNHNSLFASIAAFGLGTCAGFLAGGIPGAILGNYTNTALGVQSIKDTYDEAIMTKRYDNVLAIMEDREKKGLSIGTCRLRIARRQWVSSNGNSYSGVYEVPIDAIYVLP